MSEDWGAKTDGASPANEARSGEDCEDWGSNKASNNDWRRDSGNNSFGSRRDDGRRGFRGNDRGGRGYGFNSDRRRDGNDSRSDNRSFNNYDSNRRPRGEFQGSGGGDKSTFMIPSSDVGRVIGRGGATIKDLQANSGARIKVNSNRDSYESETLVEVFGSEEERNSAKELIMEIVERPPMPQFRRQE